MYGYWDIKLGYKLVKAIHIVRSIFFGFFMGVFVYELVQSYEILQSSQVTDGSSLAAAAGIVVGILSAIGFYVLQRKIYEERVKRARYKSSSNQSNFKFNSYNQSNLAKY